MDLEEQNRKLRAQVVELEEQKEEVPIEENTQNMAANNSPTILAKAKAERMAEEGKKERRREKRREEGKKAK